MNNTLIFFMSMLFPNSQPTVYTADGFSITGTQTNEAAAKYIIKALADKGDRLHRIIAITSREAKESALEVFSEGLKEFCGDSLALPEIVTVDTYDGEIELPEEAVLAKVMELITPDDLIYLDVSGGKRTHANMMLLLMKLVRYKGIRLADALYSEKNGASGKVSSHSAFYKNLDILDGANQLAVTGRSGQLSEYFSSFGENSSVRRLLDVMEEFSGSISLCSISELDDILKRMKLLIQEAAKPTPSGMDDFLFRQLIPVISSKFFGESNEPDYCHIILWCLENHLIQQAVTLYVEKIPKYVFDKELVTVTDEIREEVTSAYGKPEELNLEKELFFSRLMSAGSLSADEQQAKDLISELRTALLSDEYYNGGNDRILKAIKLIMSFRRQCIYEGDCYRAIKAILKDGTNRGLCAIAEQLDGKSINCNVFGTARYLANNEPVLRAALHLPPSAKGKISDETIERKVRTIGNVVTMPVPYGFTFNISRSDLRSIMLGYLYARGIRNRINHAADKNNSTSRMDNLLTEYGFDIAFKEDIIIEQLKNSVTFISKLTPQSNR